MCLFPGLTDITHSMSSPPKITPFLPGHFEVFDLKPTGKVESIQMARFHYCTQEPSHAVYDTVEMLPSGTHALTHIHSISITSAS